MLARLREPLPPTRLALVSLGAAAAVALYCLGYTALAGRPETAVQSFAWAIVNVLPWIPALELAKRAERWTGAMLAIAAAMAVSLMLGFALDEANGTVGFEAWRRLPATAIVALAVVLLRWRRHPRLAANDSLPLLPRQIEWVRAARNYVELRAGGRTIVHRAPLSAVERQLASHGFVRIHRSMLVRRDCIARVRPEDVVMADGTHLKVGKRYRTALAA